MHGSSARARPNPCDVEAAECAVCAFIADAALGSIAASAMYPYRKAVRRLHLVPTIRKLLTLLSLSP
eukprot:scaffold9472_cov45-Phaeocystis_antarctica.AAC.1